MESFIINVMNSYGYIGICSLIMIENIFPPIPSEVILTFGGFMTIKSNMTILGVIISSTIGSILGAFLLYYIGKILSKENLIKFTKTKYGKILRLKPKDIEKADHWFDTKGNITVLFCRFIPVVRNLISIPAGMSSMPILKFTIYTLIESLIQNTVLILVGAFASNQINLIIGIIDKISYIILFILIIVIIIIDIKCLKKKIKIAL